MDQNRQCVANGECRPPHRSSKQTGRWCRGRVGIPHIWLWERGYYGHAEYALRGRWLNEYQACFSCGRRRFTHRQTCRTCGAHKRAVYRMHAPTIWGTRRLQRPYVEHGQACDCADNQHVGWHETREAAKAAA